MGELTDEERKTMPRRFRRTHRLDRGKRHGLASLSACKMAPASLFTRHGLLDVDGNLLGMVAAPPRAPKVTPAQWLAGKARAATMLEGAK